MPTPPNAGRKPATRVGAVAFALGVHLAVILAVVLSWRPSGVGRPPPAVDLDLPAPFPRVPPARSDARRAGGSPASAPKLAAPSTPTPIPSVAPPTPLRPPAPVEPLLVTPPTLVAPPGPELASPVTGAGAGAATGGGGAGTGTGSGGGGAPALADPDWVRWASAEEIERAYPKAAYRDGRSGSVLLRCLGGRDGRVRDCRVLSETPSGEGFGRAALDLSRVIRFRPLRVDGRPVEAALRIPIDFETDG